MIPRRLALSVRLLPYALALAGAITCGSGTETPTPWPELAGESGGAGGTGGEAPMASSTTSSSSSAGSSSSSGAGGAGGEGAGTSTGGGGDGGAPCGDTGPGEPNDEEATATFLVNATDCDETGGNVSGVLAGATDVDWYRYVATDELGCTVDPARSFTPTGAARLCKFAQCSGGGAASVECQLGATPATSPSGRPGCCHTQGFSMDVDCLGTGDDDAAIFLRVDAPVGACSSYSVVFHY